MSDSFGQTDRELGAALESLGARVQYPETPDIASAVRRQLDARVASRSRVLELPRRWVVAAAVIALLVAGTALIYSTSRTTIAEWFNLPGLTLVASAPDEQPRLGEPFKLGTPVSLDEAAGDVTFSIVSPATSGLDEPDEIYLDSGMTGGAVTFVYRARDGLPEAEETGVGALLTQFLGTLNPEAYAKGAPEGVAVTVLDVNGNDAYWISGESHTLWMLGADGEPVAESLRFAGNTLVWQAGDLTLRLESALSLEAALEIAASMTD